MLKTIEEHVRKQVAPAALRAEFRQHEFESMRPFCLLVFCISLLIWLSSTLSSASSVAKVLPGCHACSLPCSAA